MSEHVVGLDTGISSSSSSKNAAAFKQHAKRKAARTAKQKKIQKARQMRETKKKVWENKMKAEAQIEKRAAKYKRGTHLPKRMRPKDKIAKSKVEKAKKEQKRAAREAAKAEILLTEDAGFLEAEGLEKTYNFRQTDIAEAVDESSAKKVFNLKLDQFGPYCTRYTANGRHLLIGGRKGHIAAFDWQSGNLACEINVGETVRDVQWLHNSTMFAVAQKRHVYLYSNQGTEINFLAKHVDPLCLDFLRYHFLLVSIGNAGHLKYHDVSVGKLVADIRTRLGPTRVMRQNPYNAVMHLGHSNGTVTLWSPSQQAPLVKQFCHQGPIQALAVDGTGHTMVTAGVDSLIKVWDVRNFKDKPLHSYYTPTPASYLDFSARGCLAVAFGPHVQIWREPHKHKARAPYMQHDIPASPVQDCRFCPFEDVLVTGHEKGIDSILVPGSGEPNFDAYEANPYETVKQRREHEVKQLLDKIPHDLISLDPREVLKPVSSRMQGDAGDDNDDDDGGKNAEQSADAKRKRARKRKVEKRYLAKNKNIRDQRKVQIMQRMEKEQRRKELRAGGKHGALDRFK